MIKVSTQYTKRLLRSFEIFHFFRKSIFKSILNIFLIIYLLAIFYITDGYLIFWLFSQFRIPKSLLEVFCFLCGLLMAMILPSIYYFGIYKPLVSRLKRNYRIEKGMKIDYEFGENELKLSLSTPFENDSFIYTYNSIDKIYETSKYFYIYFSKYDLFILSKENLANEDLSKLQSIFKANINKDKLAKR